jgi:hypothetical protein
MHCELATKRSQPAYTHCHKPTTHCELATKESQRAYPPGHKARMHCDNATKHCWSASTNYDRPNKESRRADTLDGLSLPSSRLHRGTLDLEVGNLGAVLR